jgi:hypothetical protein
MLHVKAVLWLGEFAYGASPEILNPHVALQVWAGTPGVDSRNLALRLPDQPKPLALPEEALLRAYRGDSQGAF